MLITFFKIAFRNIIRGKGFTVINIAGLAVGMASAILILLAVQNEFTFDRFYRNTDRLYQSWNRALGNTGINCWNVTPKPLAPAMKLAFPEVERATRVNWDETLLFTIGDRKLNVKGTMVDPDFLLMFDFPFIKGNPNSALNEPQDIIVTRELAKKLFGDEDPIGKTVNIDNKFNYQVSAVMADLPNNTQFDFEFLLPWSTMKLRHEDDSSWSNNSTRNYVMLRPHTNLAAFNAKIKNFIKMHGEKDWIVESFLYPVSQLRLYSTFENGVPVGGNIEAVKVFTMIAVLILLIACINFMNLSTARSEKRAREVGVRKVVGALRASLISQFIGESILLSMISGAIGLVLVQLALSSFNLLVKKDLFIDYASPAFWASFMGFILLTGVLAGSYPAFFLSSFRPASVLKGTIKKINALVTPRKVLVVLQFTFAIILIVSTMIIRQQVKYAEDRKTGYDKENIISTFITGDINKNYAPIKDELLSSGTAVSVCKTSAPLTEGWSDGGASWKGQDPNDRSDFNFYNTDGGLVKTAGLQLVKGRDIDIQKYPSDSTAVLINEAAEKKMGFKEPIGQMIDQGQWDTTWHVIGVIKDFILQSPYAAINPMIIQGPHASWLNLLQIRLNGARSTGQNIATIEKIFKKYNPEYPFEYRFVDEEYGKKFEDEQSRGTLTALFAGLTIFISCLGLFGLAAYMAENRRKEIGVRKVLGASIYGITALLSKDFMMLVLIAFFVASPVSWLVMDKWLGNFPYRVDISLWIFLVAGIAAAVVALLSVSFQAIKAARANPVRSLRSE